MNEKRELIEKALGQFTDKSPWGRIPVNIDALAEQAIVVPVTVEHIDDEESVITDDDGSDSDGAYIVDIYIAHAKRPLLPGPAIAIILPVKEAQGEREE